MDLIRLRLELFTLFLFFVPFPPDAILARASITKSQIKLVVWFIFFFFLKFKKWNTIQFLVALFAIFVLYLFIFKDFAVELFLENLSDSISFFF